VQEDDMEMHKEAVLPYLFLHLPPLPSIVQHLRGYFMKPHIQFHTTSESGSTFTHTKRQLSSHLITSTYAQQGEV